MWPAEYGDVYLKSDGYLHDAAGKLGLCCESHGTKVTNERFR